MKITDVLKSSCILLQHPAQTKNEILDALVHTLSDLHEVVNIDDVRRAVYEREGIMSTGIGHEFALPHGKTNAVTDAIAAFATLKTPVDFNALDNCPVKTIFLLVGRENAVGTHLRLLSRISRIMNNAVFRDKLYLAKTPDEAMRLLEDEEEELS